MKKLLILILILFLGFSGYIIYDHYNQNKIPILSIEDTFVNIDNLYTYGTHLNIEGHDIPTNNVDLVLYNGEFISIPLNITGNNFNLSDQVNAGYELEELPIGNYYVFIRSTLQEDETTTYKYYPLKNISQYQTTTYYTLSNQNKKIVIKNELSYPTMMFEVTKNTDPEIYDIVIDPGHGGMDGGASKYGYSETDFTMEIANKVVEKLKNSGLKIKLTHEKDSLTKNDRLPEYGPNGRAVVSGEVKAKYLFSIHLNSNNYSNVNGLEVYTAADINYDFAKLLVKNITSYTGLSTSTNKINKVFDGIYTRTFTENDISNSIASAKEDEVLPYDYSTKSNYYYIIRETGGIVTGAYVDSRNSEIPGNPYYNSNTGTETYLLELGYITNKSDLNNALNNLDKYAQAIADTIQTLYSTNS